jgi:hypothetical protein
MKKPREKRFFCLQLIRVPVTLLPLNSGPVKTGMTRIVQESVIPSSIGTLRLSFVMRLCPRVPEFDTAPLSQQRKVCHGATGI